MERCWNNNAEIEVCITQFIVSGQVVLFVRFSAKTDLMCANSRKSSTLPSKKKVCKMEKIWYTGYNQKSGAEKHVATEEVYHETGGMERQI